MVFLVRTTTALTTDFLRTVPLGVSLLNSSDNDVTDSSISTTGATEDADTEDFLGTAVVTDDKTGFLLDHYFSSFCLLPATVFLAGFSASSAFTGFNLHLVLPGAL